MNPIQRWAIRATSYPTLLANRLLCALGVWRRWNWIDEHVALGGLPTRRDVRQLLEAGVRAVVNLCDEFDGHEREFRRAGAAYLRLPTPDYHCPSASDLARGVEFVRERVARGDKVLIHCKAGRKRSVVLAICYLAASCGVSAAQAAETICRARPHVDRALDRLPSVQRFVAQHVSRAPRSK